MSRNVVRIACMVLAVIMIISLLVPTMLTVFAQEVDTETQTDDTAGDAQEQEEVDPGMTKDEALQQMNELEDQLQDVKNQIDSLEDDISDQQQTQAYYQEQADIIARQIEVLKTDIENQKTALLQKEVELEAKVLQLADTKKLFEDRLKAMYIMRDDNEMSTLLGVTSFSDSLRYSENLQQISISDTDLIEKYRTEEAELEAQAADIQARVDELTATQEQLDAKSVEYQSALLQVNTQLSESEATLQAQETAYGDLTAQFKAAQETWLSFVTPTEGLDFVYDGGVFSWPLPGYYSISSDYNEARLLWGVWDIHRGIDMPAPAGVTIYAAADGLVSTTAHWSYGTVVKLDHGSGLVSLYGHMSARYVNSGEYVKKGDPIGAVGTTGSSTGNHLHFEVNLNGATVNPRVYLDPSVVAMLK